LEAKAIGGDVRMVYSPLEAVKLASDNPTREIVFFAVGFETTAPANALSVIQAYKSGIKNYSILASHVLVPPAMEAILSDPETVVNAFLAAGHVCTIMGVNEYNPIAHKYHVPIVVTGFEPVDLLQGIYMAVKQLEEGRAEVENQYARVVLREGNLLARQVIEKVFDVADRDWRGIGTIPLSGWEVSTRFENFNARKRFNLQAKEKRENNYCIAGDIMKGKKKPFDCPLFGSACTPEHPQGAPMVSSEGSCAAYYHYSAHHTESISA
jgi:hydrogenase expression/formation protein HypD